MIELSIGILGLVLYSALVYVRYFRKWDVAQKTFSKGLHHFAIAIFWIGFIFIAIGRTLSESSAAAIFTSDKQPEHILIIDNNTKANSEITILRGDSLNGWQIAYPESLGALSGIIEIEKGNRKAIYLPGDSLYTKTAIRLTKTESTNTDSLSQQIAFINYPYRKHYIFISEIADSLTIKLAPNLVAEIGLILLAMAGLLGTIYHGFRRRKNSVQIVIMTSSLLLVLFYSVYSLLNIIPTLLVLL